MKDLGKNQKKKGAVPEGRAPVMPRLEAMRLSRENFRDAVIDDHNSYVLHAPQLLRCFLVEGAERLLDAVAHGKPARERDFSPIADLLPVVAGHQDVGERAAVNIVDVQKDDHRLGGGHTALREPLLEVRDAVGGGNSAAPERGLVFPLKKGSRIFKQSALKKIKEPIAGSFIFFQRPREESFYLLGKTLGNFSRSHALRTAR